MKKLICGISLLILSSNVFAAEPTINDIAIGAEHSSSSETITNEALYKMIVELRAELELLKLQPNSKVPVTDQCFKNYRTEAIHQASTRSTYKK
jgi:hypothetical protein